METPARHLHSCIITHFTISPCLYLRRFSVCPCCRDISCSKFCEAASDRITVFSIPVTRIRLVSSVSVPLFNVADNRFSSEAVSSRETRSSPLSAFRMALPFLADSQVAVLHIRQQRLQVDGTKIHRGGYHRLLFLFVRLCQSVWPAASGSKRKRSSPSPQSGRCIPTFPHRYPPTKGVFHPSVGRKVLFRHGYLPPPCIWRAGHSRYCSICNLICPFCAISARYAAGSISRFVPSA